MTVWFDYQENLLTVVPGRLADAILVYGCNLSCPYCPVPYLQPQPSIALSMDDILAKTTERAKSINTILISGGEPSAHPEIIGLIKNIKETSNLDIVLETNALEPDFIEQVSFYLFQLRVDIKATSAGYTHLSAPWRTEEVAQRLQAVKKTAETASFCSMYHTTMYPPLIDSYETLYEIADFIPVSSPWYLRQYYQSNPGAPTPFSSSKLEHLMRELRVDLNRENIYLKLFAQ